MGFINQHSHHWGAASCLKGDKYHCTSPGWIRIQPPWLAAGWGSTMTWHPLRQLKSKLCCRSWVLRRTESQLELEIWEREMCVCVFNKYWRLEARKHKGITWYNQQPSKIRGLEWFTNKFEGCASPEHISHHNAPINIKYLMSENCPFK
jgi:hypothetical protein